MAKRICVALAAAALMAAGIAPVQIAHAEDTIKIGFIAPSTGQFAQIGNMMIAGAKYFVQENGTKVAGKTIELIIRDDGGQPDNAKRIAQEFVVNDKVAVLAGFTFTPVALAVAPIATEAKVPQVVMAAGTSIITEKSPYIVRTFYTTAQAAVPMAQWAAKNGVKKVVTLVSDYAPGYDAEKLFGDEYKKNGGEIVANVRVPVQSPDFAPYLQRARRQSGRHLRLYSRKLRRHFRPAICRARLEYVRHQADGQRRHDRRRSAESDGRSGPRHHHRGAIFRRASLTGKQGLRRGLHQIRRQAPEPDGGIGL
jgi:hypothetical protein